MDIVGNKTCQNKFSNLSWRLSYLSSQLWAWTLVSPECIASKMDWSFNFLILFLLRPVITYWLERLKFNKRILFAALLVEASRFVKKTLQMNTVCHWSLYHKLLFQPFSLACSLHVPLYIKPRFLNQSSSIILGISSIFMVVERTLSNICLHSFNLSLSKKLHGALNLHVKPVFFLEMVVCR